MASWYFETDEQTEGATHSLFFDEVIAHEREDLVEDAIAFLATVEGVSRAEHIDREFAELTAPSLSVEHLTSVLSDWWKVAIKRKTHWQLQTDVVASALHGLLKPLGYKKRRWAFNRVVNGDVTHVIDLHHYFDDNDGHTLVLSGAIHLPKADGFSHPNAGDRGFVGEIDCQIRFLFRSEVPLPDDGSAFIEYLTKTGLPELEGLSTADQLLAAMEAKRPLNWAAGKAPYREHLLHGLLLVSLGRREEAFRPFLAAYEDRQPRQRPHLLEIAERCGIEGLPPNGHPHISDEEMTIIQSWISQHDRLAEEFADLYRRTATGPKQGLFRSRKAPELDGSLKSLELVSAWLRENRPQIEGAITQQPRLPLKLYGVGVEIDVSRNPENFATARQALCERLAAYCARVLMGLVPGCSWSVSGDGCLSLSRSADVEIMARAHRALVELSTDHAKAHPRDILGDFMKYDASTLASGRPPDFRAIRVTAPG